MKYVDQNENKAQASYAREQSRFNRNSPAIHTKPTNDTKIEIEKEIEKEIEIETGHEKKMKLKLIQLFDNVEYNHPEILELLIWINSIILYIYSMVTFYLRKRNI